MEECSVRTVRMAPGGVGVRVGVKPGGLGGGGGGGGGARRVQTRIVSYTVISRASKPIIRRRRVAQNVPGDVNNNSQYPWEMQDERVLKQRDKQQQQQQRDYLQVNQQQQQQQQQQHKRHHHQEKVQQNQQPRKPPKEKQEHYPWEQEEDCVLKQVNQQQQQQQQQHKRHHHQEPLQHQQQRKPLKEKQEQYPWDQEEDCVLKQNDQQQQQQHQQQQQQQQQQQHKRQHQQELQQHHPRKPLKEKPEKYPQQPFSQQQHQKQKRQCYTQNHDEQEEEHHHQYHQDAYAYVQQQQKHKKHQEQQYHHNHHDDYDYPHQQHKQNQEQQHHHQNDHDDYDYPHQQYDNHPDYSHHQQQQQHQNHHQEQRQPKNYQYYSHDYPQQQKYQQKIRLQDNQGHHPNQGDKIRNGYHPLHPHHNQHQQLQQDIEYRRLEETLLQQPYLRERRESSENDEELDALDNLPDRVLMFNKRDPVSILMEYGQTREVKVGFTDMSRSGPHHASRFHTAAVVDGETYALATGTSKKNAKKAASIMTLRTMYERGMTNLGEANDSVNREMKSLDGADPLAHSSKIMHAARRLLEVAEETQFINYSKDKVLAAIVLERRGVYTVAGLGTGNRCIQYQHMSSDGSRVIHSHAEVIARRAFIRFALRELGSYKATEKHPLFARSRHTGLFKLHDDIKVHLYISRPPCGDAAAFPTITNFPNRMRAIRKQGQLRTIIDDGEGAIPTDFPLPANANGKERLRVMTCSDKILRWNAVGIQGGLLSNFMDPIYLNSLVIGSHTGDQQGHVPRAISGRLKCGRLHEVLVKPYRICSPDIVYPPCSDNYAITKSKQYCITWSEGDPDAEVIDAVTGSVAMEPTENSPSSRVSKRTLLALFRAACENLKAGQLAGLSYGEAKRSARAYQRTKQSMEDHLLSCGFGQWLSLHQSYGTDDFTEEEAGALV